MLPKVYVNSFPKGGTNLAIKLLGLLGLSRHSAITSTLLLGKKRLAKRIVRGAWPPSDFVLIGVDIPTPLRASWLSRRLSQVPAGGVIGGHVGYSDHFFHLLEAQGFRCIQVIRDPRDIAVSHAHYVSTLPTHFLYRHYGELDGWSNRLAFSITGGAVKGAGYLESINSRARSLEGWMKRADVLTVRFEDLVGAQGGGSEKAQRVAIIKICTFLGLEHSSELIDEVCDSVYGDTRTYRKGQIGSWKEEFSAEHIRLFAKVTGDLLRDWSYESE